ncbi:MAG: tetratricopeptide repeat protein, partial [Promethearchaeota archaeon]
MKLTDGKTRVLLHLQNQNNLIESQVKGEVPFKICQKGIAEAVNLTRPGVIYIINNFISDGIIKKEVRRVVGLKRRRKVYTLTRKGLEKAKKIREKIEEKKVTVKTKSNEEEIKLEHIDTYIDSRNPLLVALRKIKENDVIDLTQTERKQKDIFSGRKDELQFLQNRLEMVKNSGSSTILIKGEAGIGKTRLANEFKNYAHSEDFDFLIGKSYYDSLEPYLPFKEAFEKFQNSNETNPMAFSYINEKNQDREDVKEKKSKQDLIFSETIENIRSLAEEHPMVIFIDDLQWADKSSLMLFHYLTEKLEDASVLFIGTYRTEDVDRNDFLKEVLQRMNRENLYEELELEPLSWEDTREIVQGIIGRRDIPDHFINIIYETTEGNPLFAKEFVKQMLEDGYIDSKNDKYPSKKDDIEIPEVVDDIIKRRLKKLDQDNLRILKIGSIIGEEVPFELLDLVTDVETLDLLEYVDILTGTGLWDNELNEDIFYFTHGLIQLSVYENISRPLKKELHKRVAESIEELFEDEIKDHYSDLGFHYKRAEEFSKGFEYHRKAGDKAEEMYSHEDALEMYKEALKLAEKGNLDKKKRWKILEKLGDVNKIIGKYDVSIEYYEKVLQNNIEPKYKKGIYSKMASVYERQGEFNKALEAVNEELEKQDKEDIETCRLLKRKGLTLMYQGKYYMAEKNLRGALDICEKFGVDGEYAGIMRGLSVVHRYKGRFDEAIDYLEKALERYQKNKNIHGEATSFGDLGNIYMRKGDLDEAFKYYEKALERKKKVGDKKSILAPLNNIGDIYRRKGKFDKAIEYYEQSYNICKEIGNQQGIAITTLNLGISHMRKGKLDYALKNMKKSLEISKKINSNKGISSCLNYIGEIYSRKNKLDEAKEYFQESLKLFRKTGNENLLPLSLLGLAKVHLKKGETKKALEYGREALELSRQCGAEERIGNSHEILGRIYRTKEELERAKKEFEEGEKI